MSHRNWIALWCASGKELAIARVIEDEHGLSTYVPVRRPSMRGKLIGRGLPVIPRYVLVRIEDEFQIARLRDIDGVGGSIRDGEKAARIWDDEVERLKASQSDNARRELMWWLVTRGHIMVSNPHRPKRGASRAQRRKERKALAKAIADENTPDIVFGRAA